MILLAARAAAGQLLQQIGFVEGSDYRLVGASHATADAGDVPAEVRSTEEAGSVTTVLSMEGLHATVVTEVRGDIVHGSHSNLLGLPLAEFTSMLRDPRFSGRVQWRIRDTVAPDHGQNPPLAVGEPQLVLASASPRRRQLIREIVPEDRVRVAVSDHEEHREPGETAQERVCRLAREKADLVARMLPGLSAPVLGADTEVVVDGESLGKPASAEDAMRMLRMLSGRTHQVITGVALLGPDGVSVDAVATDVTFRHMADEEIRDYVACGEPAGKAGAYAIQGRGAMFISRIDGSYTNVVGLPVERVREMLREQPVRRPLESL